MPREDFLNAMKSAIEAFKEGIINNCSSIRGPDKRSRDCFTLPDKTFEAVDRLVWSGNNQHDFYGYNQFLFLLHFDADSSKECFSVRGLKDIVKQPKKPQAIGDIVRELDALYKLYTVLFKHSPDTASILEQSILFKCANILEQVYDPRGMVSGKNPVLIVHLLDLFLFSVRHLLDFPDAFRFDWSYSKLFCHCIRHNNISTSDGKLLVSNVVGAVTYSCIIERKRFVKIAVSLVNIVEMVLDGSEKMYLPNAVIDELKITNTSTEDIPTSVIEAIIKTKNESADTSNLFSTQVSDENNSGSSSSDATS